MHLLWFRNDLRIHDNPALLHALKCRVKFAVFFISKQQWQHHHMADIKIDFMLRHVELLKQQLASFNVELITPEVDDFNHQVEFLKSFCQQHQCTEIIANKELEWDENQRDKNLQQQGLTFKYFESDVIVPKGKVLNKTGQMYKVFTPFKRAWLQYVIDHGFEYINKQALSAFDPNNSPLAKAHNERSFTANHYNTLSAHWPLAPEQESQQLAHFLSEQLADYHQLRDIPSCSGTSRLSPYLAIGAISTRYLLRQLLQRNPDILHHIDGEDFVWLNELIWREFYRHLMHHFPKLSKDRNFNGKYDQLNWPNSKIHFQAWCEGRTGYPIVDAAMRQLLKTGWMHNRLRMITASFLTKHLLVDWRLGERFFRQHLIDGDLAANNGGWQWAAGTGCDAQPYFRIFNPITQSQRFDPKGLFIRKYLPELESVPASKIHFPHQYLKQQQITTYWPAIVDHKEARMKALDFYKSNIN
ncbi:deoxyribodipyrimidine photo-lyase [Thalassotalea aquiviva]|uniref:deoxyribodipyrimidine photo-lyase n=1 Tax=Thalassotalea aquiviva TaxID=3242415 RepID=UPI00352AC487